MFASPSWGGSQGALGEHEKLLPRALVIVLCCSSKSSRQHPAPEVARSSGHMAQSARAASLDFHKSWQLRVSRSWASASRTSAVSRAARGVQPMPARDTHPTNPATLPALGLKPSGGHLALQSACQVTVDVMLHGGHSCPASSLGRISARAADHGAVNSGSDRVSRNLIHSHVGRFSLAWSPPTVGHWVRALTTHRSSWGRRAGICALADAAPSLWPARPKLSPPTPVIAPISPLFGKQSARRPAREARLRGPPQVPKRCKKLPGPAWPTVCPAPQ